MEYDIVVGIEIHVELKTATKMFSGAPYAFKKPANTCDSVIDLAHPGTLPCVNKEAVRKAIEACTALNLEIDPLIRFDRKNYYYTDLPKGYQITQQFHPIGRNGWVEIAPKSGKRKVRINRIHMEEDTAKQFHLHDETLIDYNRAGVPLVEIVSEPDMHSGEEAALYVEKLRQTLDYLDVSDVKMEEGSMRCDTNVSIMPKGSNVFGTKVEIKNLNSIANIAAAIDYEAKRQAEVLESGGTVVQETRRFDEKTQTTVTMRRKEGTVDYKYFPEPNIFPIRLSEEFIKAVQEHMPELPDAKEKRYHEDYPSLSDYDISVLLGNKEMDVFFEETMQTAKNAKTACNFLATDLSGLLAKKEVSFAETKLHPASLAKLVNMIEEKTVSTKQAKEILELMLEGEDPEVIAKEKGMKQLSDEGAIAALVAEVLDENPQSIADYKNGKTHAQGYLVGQVMKKSKGQANPKLAAALVAAELAKR